MGLQNVFVGKFGSRLEVIEREIEFATESGVFQPFYRSLIGTSDIP
ncbi:hypothetical protein G6L97_26430 (plasmid) [Agrobacterium tumefaciens]|nr:hypothetical protein [Agrobacterium tumefaciens]WCA73014.1 hypothetical protein G6L97_26430 [Agrobacterium tumefaciens]